jgi:hypothetical protein
MVCKTLQHKIDVKTTLLILKDLYFIQEKNKKEQSD